MNSYRYILLLLLPLTFITLPADAQKRKTVKKAVTVDPIQKKYEQYQEMPILNAMFIDSVKTRMEDITEKIIIPEHAGKLIRTEDGIGYENDFAGIRLVTRKNGQGRLRIYQQFMLGKEWSEPTETVIDEEFEDICSPWLMPDGQTLYFAARETEEEEDTTYCLYTSMLDTSTRQFMKPQKLPVPLNGEGSSLCYIEDEIDNIAWFVTTRHQANGYVTLYTIKPHEPWEYYDNTTLGREKLVSVAELQSICDTWESNEARAKELQRINELAILYAPKEHREALFILANGTQITDASQLQTATGKALLRRYIDLKDAVAGTERQLSEYRVLYHNSKESARRPLRDTIVSLEKRYYEQHQQLEVITKELRVAK